MPRSSPPESPPDGGFPTTHWTLIARLHSPNPTDRTRALNDLCLQYHFPLYCYIRRHGLQHHDAQDALHDFLARLLRLESLATADSEKGRLRNFLLTALQRYLITWQRGQHHRRHELSADAERILDGAEDRYQQEQFPDTETPDRIYQRTWAAELMQTVLVRLRCQYEVRNKLPLFDALRPVLLDGGSLREDGSSALAAELGIKPGTLRIALMRLLRDYRQVLEEEILQTVRDRQEAKEEFRELMSLFAKQ
ncbi:MAG TPA: hypothetical protein VD994_08125 [Prosthecobacter sp.]|nr:hypothetical protein [Prosthecobacter sp.]